MKSRHEEVKYESIENLDAEVLQYMQHFFSDYQHIFRQFNVLNRKVRAILAIDQDRYPEEYQAHLKSLLSDNHDFNDESILKKIIELPWTNH
jgi:uracil DNA glycosylase